MEGQAQTQGAAIKPPGHVGPGEEGVLATEVAPVCGRSPGQPVSKLLSNLAEGRPVPPFKQSQANHAEPNSSLLESASTAQRKTRKRKDPNAPRKPLSAYIMYTNSQRDRVKQEMGPNASAQEITKRLADMWNHISEEERRLLQSRVDYERLRYDAALRSYFPPPDLDGADDDAPPRRRMKKDREAPKRPRTAYILFSMDYRKCVDPSIDFRTATSMAADAWKKLNETDRARYEDTATNERYAYEAAMQVYKQHKEEQDVSVSGVQVQQHTSTNGEDMCPAARVSPGRQRSSSRLQTVSAAEQTVRGGFSQAHAG